MASTFNFKTLAEAVKAIGGEQNAIASIVHSLERTAYNKDKGALAKAAKQALESGGRVVKNADGTYSVVEHRAK